MRARARFGVGDQNGAREDFVALLKTEPSRTLTGQVSPRVVAIFEEAQKSTITMLKLTIAPPTAEATIDGIAGQRQCDDSGTGRRTHAAGETARLPDRHRDGHRRRRYDRPRRTSSSTRSSAVLSIVTSPADVEVVIDGISKGKTLAGPPPADYAPRAARRRRADERPVGGARRCRALGRRAPRRIPAPAATWRPSGAWTSRSCRTSCSIR